MNSLEKETSKSVVAFHPIFQALDLTPIDWMTIRDLLELGDTENDRPLVVVLALMFAAMREGSLCLELNDNHVGRLVPGTEIEKVKGLISQFLVRLDNMQYQSLVATGKSIHYPLVFDASNGAKRLYFQKYYLHEKHLHRRIETFLSVGYPCDSTGPSIDAVLNEIFSEKRSIRMGKTGHPISRDPDQVAAIRQALSSSFTIISGGPGTGKTSVMVNILRGLVRTGIPANRIVLAAPTGRAAWRITEAVSKLLPTISSPSDEDRELLALKGSTLHKLLRYSHQQHDFYYREGNPLPADAAIIDEVSMVDVVMLAKLLNALDPACTRLILMGDKDQLPSVEAGAVFAEMIPADDHPGIFKDHLVVLRNVYRAGTQINRLAATLNRGQCPDYEPVAFRAALGGKSDRWAVVAPMVPEQWRNCLHQWADHYLLKSAAEKDKSYTDLLKRAGGKDQQNLARTGKGWHLLEKVFALMGRMKILTLLRHGPSGCTGINQIIAQYLAPCMDSAIDPVNGLFSGALIMVTRNDYGKDLFNGDMGVVIGNTDGGFRAYFQRGDEYHSFAVGQLPSWEPAFAITVHKSQGSEFDDILLVLPESPENRLLTREILYTGVTRARKRVIIYGRRQSIKTAVSRKIARQSGLVWESVDQSAG
ncbi:MAG: exodeoxyribonuclease V subunit alpha [Thermodesulfobacteriota bacterium]|nr:exodeoxyribonuclease V subunit alpha [Thermodesulfobacteriota bacterium]